MSTATAMRRSNPWVIRALGMRGIETQEVEGDGDIKVAVDTVYFTDHGPRSNYRPVLHIRGRLVGLVPYDSPEIAYGVTEVVFDDKTEGGVPVVDAFYEFTDEQLVVLVGKGYFNEGFEPPSDLIDQVWTLPARYQGLVIAPEHENDAPLVFIDVIDRDGLLIDVDASGLDLSDYFPDYLSQLRAREAGVEHTVDPSLERTSQIDDVFEGATFGEYEPEADGTEETEGRVNEAEGASMVRTLGGTGSFLPTMSSPLFDALMRDAQAKYGEDFTTEPVSAETEHTGQDAQSKKTVEQMEPSDRASLTRDELGESFMSVMGDFISRSVDENTPGTLDETEPSDDMTEPVAGTGVSEEKAKAGENADRAVERRRVSVREAVENAAPSRDSETIETDIDAIDFGVDEPEF